MRSRRSSTRSSCPSSRLDRGLLAQRVGRRAALALLQLPGHQRSSFMGHARDTAQVAVLQLDVTGRSNIRCPGTGRPSRQDVDHRLDSAIAEVRDRLGGLPTPDQSRAIWDDLWVHEAHSSTAIEGNTLVLREAERLSSRDAPSATASSRITWRSRATPTPHVGSAAGMPTAAAPSTAAPAAVRGSPGAVVRRIATIRPSRGRPRLHAWTRDAP